jgi:hypothetical protein
MGNQEKLKKKLSETDVEIGWRGFPTRFPVPYSPGKIPAGISCFFSSSAF